jgi:multidrug efflux system outer membrane protein
VKERLKRRFIPLVAALTLAACAPVEPYTRPEISLPANWSPEYPWQPSHPNDAQPKGPWWELFRDTQLNQLEQQALAQNPGLMQAETRLDQAKALATVASAGLYPQINLTAGATRFKTSENRPQASPTVQPISMTQNDFTLGLAVNYEADFSGRVHNAMRAAEASAQQAQVDLENARLLLAAEIASDYYAIRALDAELNVVKDSIDLQRKALAFVADRHALGAATGLDLAQQQAQLDATLTQVDTLEQQRTQLEHALATLSGVPAPEFKLAPAAFDTTPPEVPVSLPSELLERRPDVASAERAMATANAQIGVAKAAFYPSVALSPTVGLESAALSNLINASSLMWSLGVSAVQTLFDAGHNQGNLDYARAGYKGAVAAYRQVVLSAMQEVQDGLSGHTILARASNHATQSVQSAQRVMELANARYEGGIGTHLDVITAQQGLLAAQRQSVQITGQQFQVAVYLAKATGGRW